MFLLSKAPEYLSERSLENAMKRCRMWRGSPTMSSTWFSGSGSISGRSSAGAGATRIYENVHTRQGGTDWTVALDQLARLRDDELPCDSPDRPIVREWFTTWSEQLRSTPS